MGLHQQDKPLDSTAFWLGNNFFSHVPSANRTHYKLSETPISISLFNVVRGAHTPFSISLSENYPCFLLIIACSLSPVLAKSHRFKSWQEPRNSFILFLLSEQCLLISSQNCICPFVNIFFAWKSNRNFLSWVMFIFRAMHYIKPMKRPFVLHANFFYIAAEVIKHNTESFRSSKDTSCWLLGMWVSVSRPYQFWFVIIRP